MGTKRRRFLAMAGACALSSSLVPRLAVASLSIATSTAVTANSQLSVFRARIRDWFYLLGDDNGHPVEVCLVGVQDRGSNDTLEQFSLVLVGRSDAPPLTDGFYGVAGETFSLFIKYIGSRRGKCRYSADFALLK